ncbi:carbon-nitrogen hydrolase [Desulfovibrio inopinatus]|uniref:carbon-nitrogen hydrolase n=1 Tax=Desulfovibrio inopinatus TaxID=102109 RepID=UPI000423EC0F|nr:carbon-nitrogen hydrolase [Desulfovibrio inopinatus]
MPPFTVALIQMHPEENTAITLEKAEALLSEAADSGADIACLPELFLTPYFCQTEDHDAFNLAEPIPGPTTQRLSRLAREKQLTIVASLFEKRAPGLFHNTMAVLTPDRDVPEIYRKMHIPDDPGYYEKFFFTPGDLGFRAFDTPHGKIGGLICWDQWYPEAARLTAMHGAQILFYPTAIGWHPAEKAEFGEEQQNAWLTIQRSHAIANGLYVAGVNRVGHEIGAAGGDGIEFWGTTFLADPMGNIIAQADTTSEQTLLAEIDPQRIETIRQHWPFWRDRRIDAYTGIDRRFF